MATRPYIVAGPATIGNCFGFYGQDVPAGRFAVCTHGEYANGGRGPSQVGPQKLYATEEEAAQVAYDLWADEVPRS